MSTQYRLVQSGKTAAAAQPAKVRQSMERHGFIYFIYE
jgi:hypothetical protein